MTRPAADAAPFYPTTERECDCPAWVIRCAHLGDVRVALSDPLTVGPCPGGNETELAVWSVRGTAHPCVFGCPYPHWWTDQLVKHYGIFGRSEAAARAAFYAAEEALLAGAPDA